MNQRDLLIERLKASGAWAELTPAQRQIYEQYSNDEANLFMVWQDGLDSNFGTLDDDQLEEFGCAAALQMGHDTIRAFDGKLLVQEPGGKLRLSELGRALANFIAVAEGSGFRALPDIAERLSSVTWPCLMLVRKLAEPDET